MDKVLVDESHGNRDRDKDEESADEHQLLFLCESIVHRLIDEVGYSEQQEYDVDGCAYGAYPEPPAAPLSHRWGLEL